MVARTATNRFEKCTPKLGGRVFVVMDTTYSRGNDTPVVARAIGPRIGCGDNDVRAGGGERPSDPDPLG
jgi:hypothetical protein